MEIKTEPVLLTHNYQPVVSSTRRQDFDEITVPIPRSRSTTPDPDITRLLVRSPTDNELRWATDLDDDVIQERYQPQNATNPHQASDRLAALTAGLIVVVIMVVGMMLMISVFIDDRQPPVVRVHSMTR